MRKHRIFYFFTFHFSLFTYNQNFTTPSRRNKKFILS